MITFFGITRADDTLVSPVGVTDDGTPIYSRRGGWNFSLVLEARPGGTRAAVGSQTFNWSSTDPGDLPDLQMVASNRLGNGSAKVCDDTMEDPGGVPSALLPVDYPPDQTVANALNDLGCRFKDGTGQPGGRGPNEACVQFSDGAFRFVNPASTIQYCGFVNLPLLVPAGDTVLSARVRDVEGHLSEVARIVLRVEG